MLIEMQDFDGNKTRVVINSHIIGTIEVIAEFHTAAL